jgi:hypothetical protein
MRKRRLTQLSDAETNRIAEVISIQDFREKRKPADVQTFGSTGKPIVRVKIKYDLNKPLPPMAA